MVLLWCQVNDVHVNRLRLLQLRRDCAETISHLIAGHGNVLALDAEGERIGGEGKLIRTGFTIFIQLENAPKF